MRNARRMMRREASKGGFTLIEVLAVVTLLGILLAATLPAFRSAHHKAMRDEARSIALELASAAMEFRNVYGKWPCEDDVRAAHASVLVAGDEADLASCGMSCDIDIGEAVKTLSAADGTRDVNPRAIVFLELPTRCLYSDATDTTPCPRDPWGRPFVMLFSRPVVNSDGYGSVMSRIENGVTFKIASQKGEFTIESPDDAVAFSWGDVSTSGGNGTDATSVVGSWGAR